MCTKKLDLKREVQTRGSSTKIEIVVVHFILQVSYIVIKYGAFSNNVNSIANDQTTLHRHI